MRRKIAATLTAQFNTATVKKGDLFQINLPEGGFVGQTWKLQVVSGKASLEGTSQRNSNYCVIERTFKAKEVGEIEIVAKARIGNETKSFKVKVTGKAQSNSKDKNNQKKRSDQFKKSRGL